MLYKLFFAFEVFKAIALLILVSGRRFSYLSFIIQLDLHIPFVQPGQGVKLQLGSVAEFSIHRLWLITAVTCILLTYLGVMGNMSQSVHIVPSRGTIC